MSIPVGHLPFAREIAKLRLPCIREVGCRFFHPNWWPPSDSSSGQLKQFRLGYAGMSVQDRIHGDFVEGGGHFYGEVDLSFSAHARKAANQGLGG